MKALLTLAILAMISVAAYAITQNPASNATADSANTAQTIVLRDASGNFSAGTITLSGGAQLQSQTMAALMVAAPGAVGEVRFCSSCSPAKVVVGTGTSAGNWADAVGGTFK